MGKLARFMAVLLLPALIVIAAAPTPPPATGTALPRSIAALGDSITQANNACCGQGDHPGLSWSTGDVSGDGVTSHYERLLRLEPAIRGNNFNHAVSGANAADLPRQAAQAAENRAAYVTVLAGANDLCTASVENMTPVDQFRSDVAEALMILDHMSPRPKVHVVSIPNIYQLWLVLRDDPAAQSAWSAGRICPAMLGASATEAQRQQVLQRHQAFNAVLTEICEQYEACRTDGGAVSAHVPSPADVSTMDYFHPSLQGQAKLAEITWNAAW